MVFLGILIIFIGIVQLIFAALSVIKTPEIGIAGLISGVVTIITGFIALTIHENSESIKKLKNRVFKLEKTLEDYEELNQNQEISSSSFDDVMNVKLHDKVILLKHLKTDNYEVKANSIGIFVADCGDDCEVKFDDIPVLLKCPKKFLGVVKEEKQ